MTGNTKTWSIAVSKNKHPIVLPKIKGFKKPIAKKPKSKPKKK